MEMGDDAFTLLSTALYIFIWESRLQYTDKARF
jgi:hypothetical protein